MLERLEKRFGEREVLRGIDLEIAPGEFIAVVGRSGCGKSTLLRVLCDLEQPSSGSARVLRDGARAEVRVVFQEPRLLPWKSVLDNVCIGAQRGTESRARAVLASVGMDARASEYPGILSGGQRQRVALARALLHSPDVLLLDEPFGALDALTRIEAQRLVERLWAERGFTAVLVTHDVGEAVLLADGVLVVQEGRIAASYRVDVERPRRREHPEVARISAAVLDTIFDASPDSGSTERSIRRSGDYPRGLYTEKAVSHGTL
ncbi:MAG: ABC transporter ATP-binding protein [Myxococcota bacterium]|nr:ABC transporter ATP-binding protein [Myxococcota bacterium]